MANTGWTLGGTALNVNDGGLIAWTNVNNVLVDTTSSSTATTTASFDDTQILRVTNFGFAIPSDATINGVMFKFRRRSSTANDVKDDTIQLVLSGTPVGANKATASFWPSTNSTPEYGGAADTWTWAGISVANINNSAFGINIKAYDDASGTDTLNIEAVWLDIYYTPVGGGAVSSSKSMMMFFKDNQE